MNRAAKRSIGNAHITSIVVVSFSSIDIYKDIFETYDTTTGRIETNKQKIEMKG